MPRRQLLAGLQARWQSETLLTFALVLYRQSMKSSSNAYNRFPLSTIFLTLTIANALTLNQTLPNSKHSNVLSCVVCQNCAVSIAAVMLTEKLTSIIIEHTFAIYGLLELALLHGNNSACMRSGGLCKRQLLKLFSTWRTLSTLFLVYSSLPAATFCRRCGITRSRR